MSHQDVNANQATESPKEDLVSRLKKRVANHPIGASIIIITAAVIALSQAVPPIVSFYEYLTAKSSDTDYLDDENFNVGQREYFTENNHQAAYKAYLTAANDENPLAQAAVAKFLWLGFIGQEDEDGARYWAEKALPKLSKLVAIDHGEALYTLGWLTDNGVGVVKDKAKAISLYQRAAWKGLPWAQTNLGHMYLEGEGMNVDKQKAADLFQRAAEQNYAPAQYELGRLYRQGEGVGKDFSQALNYFSLAASTGYSFAQYRLGRMYQLGEGTSVDVKKAVHFYTLAAEQGHDNAQWSLAYCYRNAIGVKQNLQRAFELYTLSANQGNSSAQNNLAIMYENGQGVEQDQVKANQLYQLAADQGNATAQNNLGVNHEMGKGLPVDLKKALALYMKAAEQAHASAQINAGIFYRYGKGVEQSDEKAAEYYALAAAQNDAEGQTLLGELYQFGKGVEKDNEKAVDLYKRAHAQSFPRASMRLGAAYLDGRGGLEKDEVKAKTLIESALTSEEQLSHWLLSILYGNKESALYDETLSLTHLKAAAESGHFCAQNNYGVHLQENSTEAIKQATAFYAVAASQGHKRALNNFIAQVKLGNAAETDIALVRDYYFKQAQKKSIRANLVLADWYKQGVIVEKDLMKSVSYFFEAKKLGSDEADEQIAAVLAPQHTFAATCPTGI